MGKYNKIRHELNRNLDLAAREKQAPKADSIKHYRDIADRFSKWAEKEEGTKRIDPEKYHDLAQRYIDERISRGLSADTIHTDVAALARAMEVKMNSFSYPMRSTPTKGRESETHSSEKTARLEVVRDKIGIRLNEYQNLKHEDLKERDGHLYVEVRQGKGGKYQEQFIRPEYEKDVREFFGDVRGEKGYILSKEEREAAKEAGTHAGRREYAREMYEYFLRLPEKEKQYFRNEMKDRFEKNPKKAEKESYKTYTERLNRTPTYHTRGNNRNRLEAQGRPTHFDREALMMTSVFCLAHYREDVTVKNYLI